MSEESLSSSIVYDELAKVLSAQSSLTGPAECHGIITAVVTALGEQAPGVWVSHIMGEASEEAAATLMLRVLEGLRKHVAMQLDATDMGFALCVPDDEALLSNRAASLVEWCEGYLFGLGLSEGLDLRSLSADSQEFISDLKEVTKLNVEIMEPGEEDEVSYMELYEYIRLGVQYVYDELHAPARSDSEVLH